LNGNAGLASGFAGSLSGGVGFTAGNSWSSPVDIGGYSSYGGLVGGPLQSTTLEGSSNGSNPYSVFGLAGGPSVGLTFTNASRISQLQGLDTSHEIDLGIGSISWSYLNGIWAVSLTYGGKPILSYSSYPVMTNTGTAISFSPSGGGGYGSAGSVYTNYVPANAHTACGKLCQ
jgi:hypothetical protein